MVWFPPTIIVVNPMGPEITGYSWSFKLPGRSKDLALEREMISSFL